MRTTYSTLLSSLFLLLGTAQATSMHDCYLNYLKSFDIDSPVNDLTKIAQALQENMKQTCGFYQQLVDCTPSNTLTPAALMDAFHVDVLVADYNIFMFDLVRMACNLDVDTIKELEKCFEATSDVVNACQSELHLPTAAKTAFNITKYCQPGINFVNCVVSRIQCSGKAKSLVCSAFKDGVDLFCVGETSLQCGPNDGTPGSATATGVSLVALLASIMFYLA